MVRRKRMCVMMNLAGKNEQELYDEMEGKLLEKMAAIEKIGSGWEFRSIVQLDLHTVEYDPMRAARHIPLPKKLDSKKAIFNMENTDNKCFLWSVFGALNPKKKNPQRIDKELKKKEDSVNIEE